MEVEQPSNKCNAFIILVFGLPSTIIYFHMEKMYKLVGTYFLVLFLKHIGCD